MTRIILLLAVILGLAAGAGAAQKYLDLDAGSNGNGAIATPWNTWSTPKGSLSHGDTLWCRGPCINITKVYGAGTDCTNMEAWPME